MSDSAQVLAVNIPTGQTTELAAEILAWLADERIIDPLPTDSGLGRLAHRPGKDVNSAVVAQKKTTLDFRTLRTNGMEIEYDRKPSLRTNGDEMPTFACPKCKHELDVDAAMHALNDLGHPFKPVPELKCPKCKKASPVVELVLENAVFANLTLRFWNWWPLKPAFVSKLEKLCGVPVVLLHEHL